jgi:hypothetical protein
LALIHTPQTFSQAADSFVKKTKFAMEQFFGRIYRHVQLPKTLPQEDLLAAARIHFPEMDDEQLEEIADEAIVSSNYLQALEAIAKLARYIARREGHRRATSADIEAAAGEVVPRRAAPMPDSAPEPAEQIEARRVSGRAAASASKRRCKPLATAVQPSRMQSAKTETLVRDSFRRGELEKPERDIVLVET